MLENAFLDCCEPYLLGSAIGLVQVLQAGDDAAVSLELVDERDRLALEALGQVLELLELKKRQAERAQQTVGAAVLGDGDLSVRGAAGNTGNEVM